MQCKSIFSIVVGAILTALLLVPPAGAGGVRGIAPKTVLVSSGIYRNEDKRLYIVELEAPPAAAMQASNEAAAGTDRRTAMRNAGRLDINDSRVRQHISKLRAAKNKLLGEVGALQDEIYSYNYSFNGMAVMLTPTQAEQLGYKRGVKGVWEDQQRVVMSGDTAAFLGLLNSDNGLHEGLDLKGEDIIVGIIDSGIAPNHPSFADREREEDRDIPNICDNDWARSSLLGRWLCGEYYGDGPRVYNDPPARWQGTCESGEGFDSDACNNKLIGARVFQEGFLASGDIDPGEFNSPADADGHGTHVASIAAGNELKTTEVFNQKAGAIRGIAPRARVAVYKACFLRNEATRATCSLADLVKAIDQAVRDGVDVINYSIGSLDFSLIDPDDLALLRAADAGILSAVSAGNDGAPEPGSIGTIESPGATPWVITVGATSRPGNRIAAGVTVNNPPAVAGIYESREAAFTPSLQNRGALNGQLILVDDDDTSTEDADTGGSINDGCTAAANAGELNNRIAFIQRGNCRFDTKIENAANAGARAAVVFSNDQDILVMQGDDSKGSIPAVMIGQADGELLRDKLNEGRIVGITLDATTTLSFATTDNTLTNFSARGPDPDFLKPDVVAPGKTLLGGHTPDVANGFQGEQFQYLTGTSQAAPQIAGLAALIKEARPEWSPAEIKSAIMTTSRQDITRENGDPTTPFDIGAGQIVPNSAIDPGLLYDVPTDDFNEFLCRSTGQKFRQVNCRRLLRRNSILRANDLNLPSIQVNDLVATRRVTRRVRNPGEPQTFTASLNVPEGIDVQISPTELQLGTDQEAEYTVSFTGDGQTLNEWLFGDITWESDTHSVYSPFAAIATFFDVPTELVGSGATGSLQLPVQFGYTGNYAATTSGLLAPCVFPLDENDTDCVGSEDAVVLGDNLDNYEFSIPVVPARGVTRFEFTLDPEQVHLRVALFDALTDGDAFVEGALPGDYDDLDLYIWKCGNPATNQVFYNLGDDVPVVSTADGDTAVLADEFECDASEVNLIGTSFNELTSDEVVDVPQPTAGYYIIDVHGFDVDTNDSPAGAQFNALVWSFGAAPEVNNLALSDVPASVTSGSVADISLDWSGLPAGLFLGGVIHSDGETELIDYTLIQVDNIGFSAAPLP